jgi:hypothetical protein
MDGAAFVVVRECRHDDRLSSTIFGAGSNLAGGINGISACR